MVPLLVLQVVPGPAACARGSCSDDLQRLLQCSQSHDRVPCTTPSLPQRVRPRAAWLIARLIRPDHSLTYWVDSAGEDCKVLTGGWGYTHVLYRYREFVSP